MTVEQTNSVLKSLDDIITMAEVQRRELQNGVINKIPAIAIACLKSSIDEIKTITKK